jgi:outer membrane receptor for ferrienterochelin and colicins
MVVAVAVVMMPSMGGAQAGSGVRVVRVVSRSDGGAVAGAEVRTSTLAGATLLGRTAIDGFWRGRLPDSVVVRAMGFREARIALRSDSTEVALTALPTVLPAMVTTAGQREVRVSESGRSVVVLDRAAVDAAAAVAANQLLRQLPGITELSSPPARTSLAIRGFSDARVLVLMDGEPVVGTLMDSRDIGRLSTLGTERIEVTKGPSAVEFGSDAIGGVINLVTAAPSTRATAEATLRAGAFGRREGTFGASDTFGRVGTRLTGGWRQVDRVTGVAATGTSFDRVYDLRSDTRIQLNDRLSIRVDASGSTERQRWPLDGLFNGFVDTWSGQGFVEAQLKAAGGAWRLRGFSQRFAYQYRQSQGRLPIAGSGDSLEQREQLDRALLAYSASRGGHTMDVGAQFSRRDLTAPAKVDDGRANDEVWEGYARDQFVTGPARWTLGVRHTNGSLWGASTNPSVGVWTPLGGHWSLRGNVSRGFRAPGFKELRYTFANVQAGYVITGNALLRPEQAWSQSFAAQWAPSASLAFEAEWYRTDVRDLIDTRLQGFTADGLQSYANVNVARARTAGVELQARGAWRGGDWEAGYDRLATRDIESALPLSRRPVHTARLRFSPRWNVGAGLALDLTTRYTGRAPLVTGAAVDGSSPASIAGWQGAFTALDAQWRWRWTREIELSTGVNNLLGQRPRLWSPAIDRQYFGGVRWSWMER